MWNDDSSCGVLKVKLNGGEIAGIVCWGLRYVGGKDINMSIFL